MPREISEETISMATSMATTTSTTSGGTPSGPTQLFADALTELIRSSERYAEWHSGRAALYGRLHVGLGLPASVLATVAGATGLASTAGRIPAAIIALVAAAVAAANTFLNSGQQRGYHQEMAAQWLLIAGEAKLHMVDLWTADESWVAGTGKEVIKGLLSRQAQLLKGKAAVVTAAEAENKP